MIYEGTDFNLDVVKDMSKKQFLNLGAIGNSLTKDQLSEAFDLMMVVLGKKKPKDADNKFNDGSAQQS